MKKVSLIIPLYNAGLYFEDMLKSILEQSYRCIELIVVDDGSEDESAQIFACYRERLKEQLHTVVFLSHDKNCGAACAMNTALPYCTGEYLMWADADDILDPENIAKKVAYLETNPEFVIVRCNGIQQDMNTGKFCDLAKLEDKKIQSVFEGLLFSHTYCHCGCYMVRSEAFFSCYPQRRIPVSRQGQNMQMLLPPASLSECGFIDEKLYTYRIHSTNHSRSFVTYPQKVERYHGFEVMQLEVLPHCNCDQKIWSERIQQYWKCEREKLQKDYLCRIRRKLNGDKKNES